ncbi:MAG: DUF58 domain-containing protein [Actinomycetota bacterium]
MLTRSGLGALVGAVVALGLGLLWGYVELIAVAAVLAVAVMAAVWNARRPLRAKVTRRVGTLRVPRGDAVRIHYRVRNDTSQRSANATLIDTCDGIDNAVTIEPVPPQRVVDVTGAIGTRRRGVFPLGPLDIERVDPLNLAVGRWRDERDEQEPISVTVHPKVYDLVGPQGSMRIVENESVLRRAASDPLSGFVSMREYVPGDDPRLIHWPTTARAGILMVREHVEVRRPEFTVVLDTSPDAVSEDDFEEAVDVAATIAVHSLRLDLDVVVRTTDRRHPGVPIPLKEETDVLDLLTPVQRSEEGTVIPLPNLFEHGFDNSAVVMVTGVTGPSSRLAAAEQMVTVRVGDGAELGTGIAVAAADAPDFVQRWRTWT